MQNKNSNNAIRSSLSKENTVLKQRFEKKEDTLIVEKSKQRCW